MIYAKRILSVILFFGMLAAILLMASFVFIPKNNMSEFGMEEAQANGILGEKEKKMEILLQSKTCVFMDDALMIKGGDKPVFYEQIAQVIYEKRYNSYDIVFYNEKNKKRTMQISFDDKENEEAILKILQEKVRNLEPRKAKHPIWKAGGL